MLNFLLEICEQDKVQLRFMCAEFESSSLWIEKNIINEISTLGKEVFAGWDFKL